MASKKRLTTSDDTQTLLTNRNHDTPCQRTTGDPENSGSPVVRCYQGESQYRDVRCEYPCIR